MLTDEQCMMVAVYERIFYFRNDGAHKMDHMYDTYTTMGALNKEMNLNLADKLLFAAAYLHDAFVGVDRKNHEKLAADYVKNAGDIYLAKLTKSDREIVSQAIYDHRASFTGLLDNAPLTKILRIADKGEPDLDAIVSRSIAYTIGKNGTHDMNKIYADVMSHVRDKFGKNGYAWKNIGDGYLHYYAKKMESLWMEVAGLNTDTVKKIHQRTIST